MTREEIASVVASQRAFFETGETLSVKYRIFALRKLKEVIETNQDRLKDALGKDLGKSEFEGYMCEIGMALSEISHMLKHIRSYARAKRVRTPMAQFPSRSFQVPSPYGVTLIMSPWNYPFLLTVGPLVDALAAGNTAVVKPSAYSPATSALITELLSSVFSSEYVAVVTGGREENNFLLEQKFDYIFFTGSKSVGKTVLEKASKYLTPVTLELGGKSPCILDETADLKLAARRIVFGKYLNCGQTCVAPDYILCHESVKDSFMTFVKAEIERQYGAAPLSNPNYGKMVNAKHFDRVFSLLDPQKVTHGGNANRDSLQIAPTVMDNVTWEDAVMQEEIFGPILPILTFKSIDEVILAVRSHDKPLALYVFTGDKTFARRITTECSFGGGCINDVIIHLATCNMGFGGVGESGMGSYHGKAGFDTFTHYKSMVSKKTWLDLPMRYQPYKPFYRKLIRLFLR
jgi:aldehyde dehydrogenase (NAD+)